MTSPEVKHVLTKMVTVYLSPYRPDVSWGNRDQWIAILDSPGTTQGLSYLAVNRSLFKSRVNKDSNTPTMYVIYENVHSAIWVYFAAN